MNSPLSYLRVERLDFAIDRITDAVVRAEERSKLIEVSPVDLLELAGWDDPLDKQHERDAEREEEAEYRSTYREHLEHGVTPGDFA